MSHKVPHKTILKEPNQKRNSWFLVLQREQGSYGTHKNNMLTHIYLHSKFLEGSKAPNPKNFSRNTERMISKTHTKTVLAKKFGHYNFSHPSISDLQQKSSHIKSKSACPCRYFKFPYHIENHGCSPVFSSVQVLWVTIRVLSPTMQ